VRLVVAISGSSGAIYGARLVEVLSGLADVETHLIITAGARATLEYETDHTLPHLRAFAHASYEDRDVGAALASGTFRTAGMIVAPCSMKTLAAISGGHADSLVNRAADVCLKERRRLVLVTRETPLSLIHLRNMVRVTEAGGVILPPVPGFYTRPASLSDLVDHTVTKILDQFGLDAGLIDRWSGLGDHS
jgi:flavin prenyltransferase